MALDLDIVVLSLILQGFTRVFIHVVQTNIIITEYLLHGLEIIALVIFRIDLLSFGILMRSFPMLVINYIV